MGGFHYSGSEPGTVLDPDMSATLRDILIGEIATLMSPDFAAVWAQGGLTRKNRLTADDATLVEEAFEAKLVRLAGSETADAINSRSVPRHDAELETTAAPIPKSHEGRTHRPAIDKSALNIGEPRRYRSKEHLRLVAQQACLVCARKPSDPHHLRFMQPRALGRKVSDEFTVPLCRAHHREVHHTGDEKAWWTAAGIDPSKIAQNLWRRTRGTESTQLPPV